VNAARDAVDERVDVLLVCSTGGHLLQLAALREAWAGYPHMWVTFDKSDARSLLAGERVHYAYGPTNRNLGNLVRNFGLAWRLVRRVRPRVVMTTGAGVAMPFAWIGRAFGARVVYIESFTRIDGPSLSLRLIAPVADRLYAQWPELAQALPRARFAGTVFTDEAP
jgi:UDP-N-acetylglucosamine:LPS N-acetylglucosamine transferase